MKYDENVIDLNFIGTNDLWMHHQQWRLDTVKATFRFSWSHDITSVAHEAIQYSSTSLEGEGKSLRLWAVGLDGWCNAARGLGGATSQQQTLPHTDQSGLKQENGWIWSRSWPTSFHCVEPFPCRKKKSACTSFKSKVPTTEKIHRILNAWRTNKRKACI